jgi:hypothetical protein
MNLTATRTSLNHPFQSLKKTQIRSAGIYSAIIVLALIAFEAVNYSTTAFALKDLLGNLKFIGIRWSTLLALAFCGLDFAGIARLVTQKERSRADRDSWFLFGAWLIAATFNATLTWWGVTIAIADHSVRSAELVSTQQLTTIVPVMVAIMVWVIRILIIGSLTSSLEKQSHTNQPAPRASHPAPAAGFPLNTRSGSTYNRPQTSAPAARMSNHRAAPVSMARPMATSDHRQYNRNEFMEAESRK